MCGRCVGSLRRCSAPAALAAVYLAWAPAEPGPCGRDLPRRPVRRPRLRGLEQRLVRRPLPALLQRPLPAARGAARPAARRGARGGRRGRRCSRALARRRFGDRGADPVAVVRGRDLGLAADRAGSRSCSRCRSGSARCSRRTGSPVGRRRAGAPRPACASPVAGLFVALAGAAVWLAGRAAPRGWRWRSAALIADRASSTSPSRPAASSPSCSRPSSRSRCSPVLVLWLRAARVPRAADRRGPLRAAGAAPCS